MELIDTVKMMQSDDYKERFKAEYYQLKIRYEKLKDFTNRLMVAEIMKTEPPKHDTPKSVLIEQYSYMGLYLGILEQRAIIENIEL